MIESRTTEVSSETEIRTSCFTFNNQKHIFLSLKSRKNVAEFSVVFRSLAEKLQEFNSDVNSIFRMTCYTKDQQDKDEVRSAVSDYYSPVPTPPCEIVVQPSLENSKLSIFVWAVEKGHVEHTDNDVALLTANGESQWMMVHKSCDLTQSYENFYKNYNGIAAALETNGFDPVDITRTWIYIHDIDGLDKSDNNYQGMNHARKEIYNKINFAGRTDSLVDFPASTGIGLQDRALTYSTLACKPGMLNKVISIENQAQTPAFEYPEVESKFQPLFSRAIALLDEEKALCSVSGTASILEAKSMYIGDAEKQTEVTLDNIENLISKDNLKANNIEVANGGLEAVVQFVVYIKYPENLDKIKSICQKRLPADIPQFYVHADVCRDDLLVEVEAFTLHKLC